MSTANPNIFYAKSGRGSDPSDRAYKFDYSNHPTMPNESMRYKAQQTAALLNAMHRRERRDKVKGLLGGATLGGLGGAAAGAALGGGRPWVRALKALGGGLLGGAGGAYGGAAAGGAYARGKIQDAGRSRGVGIEYVTRGDVPVPKQASLLPPPEELAQYESFSPETQQMLAAYQKHQPERYQRLLATDADAFDEATGETTGHDEESAGTFMQDDLIRHNPEYESILPDLPEGVQANVRNWASRPKSAGFLPPYEKVAQQMPSADPAVVGALTPFPPLGPLYAAGTAPSGQHLYDFSDTIGDTISGALKGLGYGAALGVTAGLLMGGGPLKNIGMGAAGAAAGTMLGGPVGAYAGAKEREQMRQQSPTYGAGPQ